MRRRGEGGFGSGDVGLAECFCHEFLRGAVFGSQSNEVVEVAERHARGGVTAQAGGEITHGLHGAGRADAGFGSLVENFDERSVDDVAHLVNKEGDASAFSFAVAFAGK